MAAGASSVLILRDIFSPDIYPSYLKLPLCWLRSPTRITYYSKLIGMSSLAAVTQLQLFWAYHLSFKPQRGRLRMLAVGANKFAPTAFHYRE
ncbi:hypothetical protein D4100_13615 [Serratia inhibens]|uniref:Uncharacterized protein n=1 Tax=Serratia inhibens TaxID=2338073 RepID=A0AA92X4V6_9GAMM|nr:hypothetical protein D4100_13615 [Serratia inhibens]